MVVSSFLSACAANINIKTTVCTIFSLPATKIQYHPTAVGNRVTERLRADRQNPGRETPEEAGRPRRSPVVGRAGERRRAEPRDKVRQGIARRRGTGQRPQAESDRTGLTEQITRNGARKTGAQPDTQDEKPGRNRQEPRAEQDEKPGRNETRDPGGTGRETRAERDERPGRAQKNGPQSSDCSPSFRERKSYFAFFLS